MAWNCSVWSRSWRAEQERRHTLLRSFELINNGRWFQRNKSCTKISGSFHLLRRYDNRSRAPETIRKAAYAHQLNKKLQTFQEASFPFKENNLFSCLSIRLWKGKTLMSPSQDTSQRVQMKHKEKGGTNNVQNHCIKILHEAQSLSSGRCFKVLFCFVRKRDTSRNQEQISIKILSRFCIKIWESNAQGVLWK